jgi:hypothetical protein
MKKGMTFVFLLISYIASAQSSLSDQAEVSIITCGPYQGELYSAFGHSAIRVHDPLTALDFVFNYGVFHFTPGFYLNFTKGDLLYKLGVYEYADFRDYYISQNRYVHEQVLNLNKAQKQNVYNFLEHNARPENATYRYDYFYNNCATKVRDVFVEIFGDSIAFDGSYVKTKYTIRDLTGLYLKKQPWGALGIDLCLGLPMDKNLTPFEYMFLPDYIESGFDHVKLNGTPIVKENFRVYEASPNEVDASLFHPWVAFGAILAITMLLSYHDWKRPRLTTWFDVILFSIVGWVGILLFLLWVATDHHAAAKNFNLFWAFPGHAIAAVLLARRPPNANLRLYFMLTVVLSTVTILSWPLLPQHLNVFLIPLVTAIAIRAYLITRHKPSI